MNYEKLKIGSFIVKEPRNVDELYETASWYKTISVSPGEYDAYVFLSFIDFKERSLGHSVFVPVRGPIVAAYFGLSGLGGYKIGQEDKATIKIPTFCMNDYIESGILNINNDLIESFKYSSTEDKTYTFYRLIRKQK